MIRFSLTALTFLVLAGKVAAQDLPPWIGSLEVEPPNSMSIGSITLSGDWLDTCMPDTISRSVSGSTIDLVLEYPGINVGCGDAITPWSLTEEFGPLENGNYTIQGTLFAVDPADRTIRRLESGPNILVGSYVVPEPSTLAGCMAILPWLVGAFRATLRRDP